MYGTSVFYFHFDINLIRFELDHRFLYLLIPLRLVIFFIAICLFAGGYQVAVNKFFYHPNGKI